MSGPGWTSGGRHLAGRERRRPGCRRAQPARVRWARRPASAAAASWCWRRSTMPRPRARRRGPARARPGSMAAVQPDRRRRRSTPSGCAMPATAPITLHPIADGLHMIEAGELDDPASPRIARFLPQFRFVDPPDPEVRRLVGLGGPAGRSHSPRTATRATPCASSPTASTAPSAASLAGAAAARHRRTGLPACRGSPGRAGIRRRAGLVQAVAASGSPVGTGQHTRIAADPLRGLGAGGRSCLAREVRAAAPAPGSAPTSGSVPEHDLADMGAASISRCAAAASASGKVAWINGLTLPLGEQRPHPLLELAGDLALLLDRARAAGSSRSRSAA